MISRKTLGVLRTSGTYITQRPSHAEDYPLTSLSRVDLPTAMPNGAVLAVLHSLPGPPSGLALSALFHVEGSWILSFSVSIQHLPSRTLFPRNTTPGLREILRSKNPGELAWTRSVNYLCLLRQHKAFPCALSSTNKHRLACPTRSLGKLKNDGHLQSDPYSTIQMSDFVFLLMVWSSNQL